MNCNNHLVLTICWFAAIAWGTSAASGDADPWQADARVEWPVYTVDVAKLAGPGTVVIQGGLLRNEGWTPNGSLLIVGHWSKPTVSNLKLFKSAGAFKRLETVPLSEEKKKQTNPLVPWTQKFVSAAVDFAGPAGPVKDRDSAIGGRLPGHSAIYLIELVVNDTLYQVRSDQIDAKQQPELSELMRVFLCWKGAYGWDALDETALENAHVAKLPVKKPARSAE